MTNHPDTGYELAQYRVKPLDHYLRAKKACEDTESWRAATVIDEEDGVVTVAIGDWPDTACLPAGRHVWFTGSVVAVPAEPGNVFAIPPISPDSVFHHAGSEHLHMMIAERIDSVSPELDIVWTTLNDLDGVDRFLAAPRTDLEYLTDVVRVTTTCTTWGEVRQAARRDLYEEFLIRSGRGTLEEFVGIARDVAYVRGYVEELAKEFENRDHSEPADDEPFHAEDIEGYMVGDWPPMVASLMESRIPADIADEYGHRIHTVINGDLLDIPAECAGDVVTALRQRRYRCTLNSKPFVADMFRFENLPRRT